MKAKKNVQINSEHFIRWSFFTVGLLLLGLGITLLIKAKDLGISPWDVFHYGLFLNFGLTIGTWSIITGIIIISVTAIITKEIPKIGTLLNIILVGVLIDFFNWLLPDIDHLLLEMLFLVLGIIISAIGVGIYVAPNLGAGPRDSVMLLISNKTGWKVSFVRNGIELVVFILGWLLGGPVGIGTIIIVLSLGTVVGYAIPRSEKLLNFLLERGVSNENINQGALRINHYD